MVSHTITLTSHKIETPFDVVAFTYLPHGFKEFRKPMRAVVTFGCVNDWAVYIGEIELDNGQVASKGIKLNRTQAKQLFPMFDGEAYRD